jgi:hypothetical protein
MNSKESFKTLSRLFITVLTVVGIVAFCTSSVLALFTNSGFEAGSFSDWTLTWFTNPRLTGTAPFTGADIQRNSGGANLSAVLDFPEMSQADPHTGNVLHFPRFGSHCARVNSDQAYNGGGYGKNANSLKQTAVAASGDVAPDGKIHIQVGWAGVVQWPPPSTPHADFERPYVYVGVWNITTSTLLYEEFMFADITDSAWHQYTGESTVVLYTDWQIVDRAFTAGASGQEINYGDSIEIEAVASGCSLGGHWGYLYLDPFGSFFPVTPSIAAANKPYDGNTTATITGRSLTGVQGSDNVSLTGGTANFDTKNVGTGKTVTATGLGLAGADAGKYMLTSFSANTTANITPKGLTVTGITANNKEYDGNTTATLNTAGATLVGVLPGDTVTLNTAGATGTFADPNPGTGKVVTVAGLTIGGADAGNYILTQPTTTANITPSPIVITVTGVNPSGGTQGQCLTVIITGTGFTGATAVNFGTGITVNSFTVNSDTQITANICIAADAALGARDVSVTTTGGTGTGTALFTVNAPVVPRASPTRSRPPIKPQALLSVQYLSINPQQVYANQPVTITTNVVNTGGEAGNLNVALMINGQVEQTRIVSVGPQGTQPVKFTVTKAQPGTYTVDIGGQKGSFTILGASSTATSKGASVGLIVLLSVLILATVVVLMLTFRRPA